VTGRARAWLLPAVALIALGLLMVLSDPYFTFIDDETSIISAATSPASDTVDLFLHGTGQFEHPPLYDLILHGWLRVTGSRMRLLRLPSIAFYLLGIEVLTAIACRLWSDRAAAAVLWSCVFWPFGFHFGRLAAWYSLSFLLVAVLTWTYLAFLRAQTVKNWLPMVLTAILLLYTSYFGWAILAFILLDYLVQTRHESGRRWRLVLLTVATVALAFLPLARAFSAVIAGGVGQQASVLGSALFEAFNMYACFASESVAPWYWALGMPVCLAIALCSAVVVLCGPHTARRLYIYFLALLTAMSVLGIVGTKRLLLISPWAVLPVGICVGTIQSRRWKAALVASLAVIAGIGWFGTIARRYYAAPRFIEPWPEVATRMARTVDDGGLVIGDHPAFFFYLTFALHDQARGNALDLVGLWPYRLRGKEVYDSGEWMRQGSPVRASVFLVKGVSADGAADAAEHHLEQRCVLENAELLLPDSGFDLKERILPKFPRVRYRIEIRHYDCQKATGFP
jgi:hypothetical protein